MIARQSRLGIKGMAPGGTEEHELGWLGWAIPQDISRDGRKVLFEEEGDGGGPNYTVFLRETDGSPPVRIGEGVGQCISPDSRWVITQPAKGGPLSIVPTGAGQPRPVTHDNINYTNSTFMPDGKQLLSIGIEPGHGGRDYLIDLNTGTAKPITLEGITGTLLSPNGHRIAVIGPDGKPAVWNLEGTGLQPIPGADSSQLITGWTPDGSEVYVESTRQDSRAAKIYRLNPATGKLTYWKTFGAALPGIANVGNVLLSADGRAYAYVYSQTLSEAYIIRGLK